ncbi:Hypothetical predicted protein [Pelobates cultripes]|uniref:Endonuclease/exonuclease/phosphatase domain-containing protein n=1 Tax=Pelobates cultripes TaxID=61616 RepID=A0AAD1RGU1_PELCU|nr:Hypothetical predicted protein [Pelobates cultripes]
MSVAMIQETHFKLGSEQALKERLFPSAYFASHPLGKKAGVVILFSQGTPFVLLDQKTDPEERYLFVKGHINSQIYTFATIYTPYSRQHIFITKTLRLLENFSEGLLILGGDLNVSLDPSMDTSRERSAVTYPRIRSIKKALRTLHLWIAGGSYIRRQGTIHTIRWCMDRTLEQITSFSRNNTCPSSRTHTWSDHAPVSLQMTSPLFKPKERTWRLNEWLLMDEEENTNPDTGRTTILEAHKSVIRGVLISIGVHKKRAGAECIRSILDGIATVELRHKQTLNDSDLRKLLSLRKDLATLIT